MKEDATVNTEATVYLRFCRIFHLSSVFFCLLFVSFILQHFGFLELLTIALTVLSQKTTTKIAFTCSLFPINSTDYDDFCLSCRCCSRLICFWYFFSSIARDRYTQLYNKEKPVSKSFWIHSGNNARCVCGRERERAGERPKYQADFLKCVNIKCKQMGLQAMTF